MASSKGWSLDKSDWTRVDAAFAGKDWTQTYLESSYSNAVSNAPGIYMICARSPSQGRAFEKMYNCLYVGKSSNLKKRFKDHVIGYKDVVRVKLAYGRLEFWFATMTSEELSSAEQAVMDAFGPSANRSNAVRAQIGKPIEL